MCSCQSILEYCVTFSGVKLNIRLFVLFLKICIFAFQGGFAPFFSICRPFLRALIDGVV